MKYIFILIIGPQVLAGNSKCLRSSNFKDLKNAFKHIQQEDNNAKRHKGPLSTIRVPRI